MTEGVLRVLFEIQTDADGRFMAAFTDTSNDREKYLRKHRELRAARGGAGTPGVR
jgi:hypothetical protein